MNESAKSKTPARRKIDFARIGSKVLVALNQKYLDSESYYVTFDEIVRVIPGEPSNAIRDELKNLRSKGKISQRTETRPTNPFAGFTASGQKGETYEVFVDGYTITRDGISEVNQLTDEAYEVLFAEIRIPSNSDTDADADSWIPLAIDRKSTEFSKAVEAAESALAALEGSNGYATTHPEQRDSLVETIKSNLKNLKDGLISKGQILEGLIKPLRSVAAQFVGASVGELAKRAANFLWTLIAGN